MLCLLPEPYYYKNNTFEVYLNCGFGLCYCCKFLENQIPKYKNN